MQFKLDQSRLLKPLRRAIAFISVIAVCSRVPQVAGATDADYARMTEFLNARCEAIAAEGEVHFHVYDFQGSRVLYDRMKQLIFQKANDKTVKESLMREIRLPSIQADHGYDDIMYYKGKKWRLVKILGNEYGKTADTWKAEALKNPTTDTKVIFTADIAFDGRSSNSLYNNATLYVEPPQKSTEMSMLADIDLSLIPLKNIKDYIKTYQIAEIIKTDDEWTLSLDDKAPNLHGDKVHSEFCYSVNAGFAPRRIELTVAGSLKKCWYYRAAETAAGKDNAPDLIGQCVRLADVPGSAPNGDNGGPDKVVGEFIVVDSWTTHLSDEKLLDVKLPAQYIHVDERFGNSPLMKKVGENAAPTAPGR